MKFHFLKLPILLVCASCATLFSDKADKITINTEPAGAEVFVNEKIQGKTPLEISVERDSFRKTTVLVKKRGYETQEFLVTKSFNNTTLWNLGFITTTSGVTSFGVDALTGGLVRYAPNGYFLKLKENGSVSANPKLKRSKLLFILANEPQLRNDLARGTGPHLDALFEIYNLEQDTELVVRQRLFSQKEQLLQLKRPNELDQAIENLVEQPVASVF